MTRPIDIEQMREHSQTQLSYDDDSMLPPDRVAHTHVLALCDEVTKLREALQRITKCECDIKYIGTGEYVPEPCGADDIARKALGEPQEGER